MGNINWMQVIIGIILGMFIVPRVIAVVHK